MSARLVVVAPAPDERAARRRRPLRRMSARLVVIAPCAG
jgi:hypothetical protein